METNYDCWNPPPRFDPRQYHAIDRMNKIGHGNVSPETLLEAFSVDMVLSGGTMSALEPDLYSMLIRHPSKARLMSSGMCEYYCYVCKLFAWRFEQTFACSLLM